MTHPAGTDCRQAETERLGVSAYQWTISKVDIDPDTASYTIAVPPNTTSFPKMVGGVDLEFEEQDEAMAGGKEPFLTVEGIGPAVTGATARMRAVAHLYFAGDHLSGDRTVYIIETGKDGGEVIYTGCASRWTLDGHRL